MSLEGESRSRPATVENGQLCAAGSARRSKTRSYKHDKRCVTGVTVNGRQVDATCETVFRCTLLVARNRATINHVTETAVAPDDRSLNYLRDSNYGYSVSLPAVNPPTPPLASVYEGACRVIVDRNSFGATARVSDTPIVRIGRL